MRRVLLLLPLLVLAEPLASAAPACDGPADCCPAELADHVATPQTVSIGIVLVGLYNLDEKASTWDADFYLYESWKPAPGFAPQTEIVNEVDRHSQQFDDVELKNGTCTRSRRIRSTLHTPFNLRMFPFDRQHVELQVSDANYGAADLTYADKPYAFGVDEVARAELSGWEIAGDPTFSRTTRAFQWEEGAPKYDYATVKLAVKRHIAFHLTRFFLPLFIIVAVAFGVFWVDPEDLSSQIGIGVTCLLAAIAFQFAQGGNLPEIAYLTLADRVYATCYVAIALALGESVYCNALARSGRKEDARKLDRFCRIAFPAGIAFGVVLAFVLSAHGG
jgi:hypothetical protein